jgi:hypothetical protein
MAMSLRKLLSPRIERSRRSGARQLFTFRPLNEGRLFPGEADQALWSAKCQTPTFFYSWAVREPSSIEQASSMRLEHRTQK